MEYNDGHLVIQTTDEQIQLDGSSLGLTRKEYALLATLAANEGEIVARRNLLREIWGYGDDVRTRTLDVHIRRIRKKLGHFGDTYIETVFGVGYRFQRFRDVPRFRSAHAA